jgi:hypothetical protein
MVSKSAVTHLQAILIIDLIVVSFAAAGFFYVSSMPGPELSASEIQLTGLQVTPISALVGEPVNVSFNVTNIGAQDGNYAANLVLDGQVSQTQVISLADGETKQVQFTISDASEGTHIVTIGSLEVGFTLGSRLEYSNLAVNRTQAAIGEPIGVTVTVTNQASDTESYSLSLMINGVQTETKTGQVNAESSVTVLFEVSEQSEGIYQLQVGSLTGSFQVISNAPPAKPAEFQVSDLAVNPHVVQRGSPATVTATVTNVGEVGGSYTATLTVNGQTVDSRSLQLAGGETVPVSFTVTESTTGTYDIKLGEASTSLIVQDPAKIELSNFVVSSIEVWGGQSIKVSVKATNPGTTVASYEFTLKVDGKVEQTQTLQLGPGTFLTPSFTFNAPTLQGGNIAHHTIDLNGLQSAFDVVKDGFHTLSVDIEPRGDADFNLILPSGATEQHTTPFSALLPVGSYSVVMPLTDPTGKVSFERWSDRSTSLIRQVNLQNRIDLVATYTGGSSCPSLFMWNGTSYNYVSDVSNHGWLGYINYLNNDGTIVYYRNNPWDYIPLSAGGQLADTNGYYNLTLLQRWNEVFYLDQAYMMVVDHPANVSVYSTMEEQYLDPAYMGNIYTLGTPSAPVSAVDGQGQNILPQLSAIDGVFTNGTHGIQSPEWDNINWNTITMDLGNLTGAKQIKLVVRAVVDWGSPDDYTTWLDKFFAQPVPDGTEITPPPYMEVQDANGNWVRVPQSRDFPLPPDVSPRTYVIDLTGLFPTNNYSLRINNFWNVTFDFIGVDLTPQQPITTQVIYPQAYLYASNPPGSGAATGALTKYGNVTELVQTYDDMFVIGRQGDAVSLYFPTANLTAPAPGMVRDFFLFEASWFKDETGNWGFGFGFTVDPLPFSNMTGFPYPADESYPNDTAHQDYLRDWNTRIIAAPDDSASQNGFVNVAFSLVLMLPVMVYVMFKSPRLALGMAKKRRSYVTCRCCLM